MVMCRAYIFMLPLRRARDDCLRLIRRSKVVSYGKPWKDLLILDGRVRQHLIPCPAAGFNWPPLLSRSSNLLFFVITFSRVIRFLQYHVRRKHYLSFSNSLLVFYNLDAVLQLMTLRRAVFYIIYFIHIF